MIEFDVRGHFVRLTRAVCVPPSALSVDAVKSTGPQTKQRDPQPGVVQTNVLPDEAVRDRAGPERFADSEYSTFELRRLGVRHDCVSHEDIDEARSAARALSPLRRARGALFAASCGHIESDRLESRERDRWRDGACRCQDTARCWRLVLFHAG